MCAVADDLTQVWRQALDANARYYASLSRLATEYLQELSDTVGRLGPIRLPTVTLPTVTVPSASTARASGPDSSTRSSTSPAAAPASGPATQAPSPPAVVLEAAPGAWAHGAVLVENHLPHPVSATVDAQLDDSAGAQSADGADITVDPDKVELAPGESTVVRVSARIPEAGAAEIRGRLSVPELIGTAVPMVIRRAATRPDAKPG